LATVIIVTGLRGSGKSILITKLRMEKAAVYIDRFLTDPSSGFTLDHPQFKFEKYKTMLHPALLAGHHCVIEEVSFCSPPIREAFIRMVRADAPDTVIVWKCFENDLEKANRNVDYRNASDKMQQMNINYGLHHRYVIPSDAEVLPIWQSKFMPSHRPHVSERPKKKELWP
jgi:hypothetical protein